MSYRPRPGIVCIDCGQECSGCAYRCQSCAAIEAGHWLNVSGHAGRGRGRNGNGAEMARQARTERITEIEEDLSYGIEPWRIANGYGIKAASLARTLYRAGRNDLAAQFHKVAA